MAQKQNKKLVSQSKTSIPKQEAIITKSPAPWKLAIRPCLTPYVPGILLFIATIIIALLTYKDYGISWDEAEQRLHGLQSYNYIFYGNQDLFNTASDHHGMGFELLLVILEKWMHLSDSRDIYLMRHLTTHIFFLVGVLSAYILILRLFRNKFLACLGFIMLAFAPRLYAHSFFNTRDLPFLSMFIITLTCCQFAFEKNKPALFFLLGILCGYTTSIRIMGVMLGFFILLFLLIDLVTDLINKEKPVKGVWNMVSFLVGFCFLLILAWPYLWKDPVNHFIVSFKDFSHFDIWNGYILVNGKYTSGLNIPWTYFPNWFLVTNPEVWLIAGFAGIVWTGIGFFKMPFTFLKNTSERNFTLYLLCFFVPIITVICLHSVIYNDWRHLYFVYPSFVLMALYFINKMLQTKYKLIVQGVCALQIVFIGYFMVKNHPFHQVYFNNFVSHKDGYLRDNYEMEYWGVSYKQGLDHLLASNPSGTIKINCYYKILLENNILLLPEDDRKRIQYAEIENANYFITNFWGDTFGYPLTKIEYLITVLNSPVLCVYKVEKDAAMQQQYREVKITWLKKMLSVYPNDYNTQSLLGNAYFQNGQYDSSETHDKKAIQLNPGTYTIERLIEVYFAEKKYQEAIELFKKEIDLNPGYVNAYSNMGRCYFLMKQYDAAIETFNKARSLNPNDLKDIPVLVMSYRALGKSDSAGKYEAMIKQK